MRPLKIEKCLGEKTRKKGMQNGTTVVVRE